MISAPKQENFYHIEIKNLQLYVNKANLLVYTKALVLLS